LQQDEVDLLGVAESDDSRGSLALSRHGLRLFQSLEEVREVRTACGKGVAELSRGARAFEIEMEEDGSRDGLAQQGKNELLLFVQWNGSRERRSGRVAALVAALKTHGDEAFLSQSVQMVVQRTDWNPKSSPNLTQVDPGIVLDEGEKRLGPAAGPSLP
jgi:hypothetical protein